MMEQVPHFCFPHGVQPLLLERTPSMSALNEVIYSQQYQNSDGCSFIFVMKVRSASWCLRRFLLGLLSLAKVRSWGLTLCPLVFCSHQNQMSDSCSIFLTKVGSFGRARLFWGCSDCRDAETGN